MLEPEFFLQWRRDEQGALVPDAEPPPEGIQYAITGYARVEAYTLVSWRYGNGKEFATGETLYRDRSAIAMGGGTLPLYEEPEVATTSLMPRVPLSVWDRVDGRVGQFGMPPAVAVALRDPANYIAFQS